MVWLNKSIYTLRFLGIHYIQYVNRNAKLTLAGTQNFQSPAKHLWPPTSLQSWRNTQGRGERSNPNLGQNSQPGLLGAARDWGAEGRCLSPSSANN